MNADTPAIVVNNLMKAYQENRVLNGVNFKVKKGSIFALLGSNGAGKTTIIKILATLMRPDNGSASVFGFDVVKNAEKVRKHISLIGQFVAVDELLTGRENLWIIGELRHLPDKKEQVDDLLALFGLRDAANKPVSAYSGGMRRRLDIAMSMMGQSPVVFLDEPTSGLDPQNRRAMWDIVKKMAGAGTTVFLTTQYLDEAEYLADHIAILHEGAVIADGTSDELKEKLPQGMIGLWFKNGFEMNKAMELLGTYTIRVGEDAYAIEIETDGGTKQFADVLNRLNQGNVEPLKFAPKQPTLQDAFLAIVGEKKGGYNA